MRVAIIGSGGIADIHAQALSRIGMKPLRIISRTPGLGSRYGIEEVREVDETALEGIEAVHICTPPHTHLTIISTLLEKADATLRFLFCEKPLGAGLEDAEQIKDKLAQRAASGHPIVFGCGFNTRFYPAIRAMREEIARGTIGPLQLVAGIYEQEFHVLPDAYNWRYDSRMRAISEIGSHLFDLIRFATGDEIAPEHARLLRADPLRSLDPSGMMTAATDAQPVSEDAKLVRVASEDAAVMTGRLERSHALLSFIVSEVTHGRKNRETLEIVGRSGALYWHSEDPMTLTLSRKGAADAVTRYAFDSGFHDTFAAQFRAFYGLTDCAANCVATIDDAIACAALCERTCELDPSTRAEKLARHYRMELIPEERVLVHVVGRSSDNDAGGRALYSSMIGMHSRIHGSFSRFHRLDVDETWHYYEGDPFRIVMLSADEPERTIIMGPDVERGQQRIFVVPKHTWFASDLIGDRPDAYALFGCTLAPAFEERGFEGGTIDKLLRDYPQSEAIIRSLAVDGKGGK